MRGQKLTSVVLYYIIYSATAFIINNYQSKFIIQLQYVRYKSTS